MQEIDLQMTFRSVHYCFRTKAHKQCKLYRRGKVEGKHEVLETTQQSTIEYKVQSTSCSTVNSSADGSHSYNTRPVSCCRNAKYGKLIRIALGKQTTVASGGHEGQDTRSAARRSRNNQTQCPVRLYRRGVTPDAFIAFARSSTDNYAMGVKYEINRNFMSLRATSLRQHRTIPNNVPLSQLIFYDFWKE